MTVGETEIAPSDPAETTEKAQPVTKETPVVIKPTPMPASKSAPQRRSSLLYPGFPQRRGLR
jgi:hypothetical protein